MNELAETKLNLQTLITYYALANENDCNDVNTVILCDHFTDMRMPLLFSQFKFKCTLVNDNVICFNLYHWKLNIFGICWSGSTSNHADILNFKF